MQLKISETQAARVHRLVQNECANYDEGTCLLLDHRKGDLCVQLLSSCSICCNYFSNAVLPVDGRLYTSIRNFNNKIQLCRKMQKGDNHETN